MSLATMRSVLRAAALYNLLWGGWVVLFPQHYFLLTGMEPANYPAIWQGTGMIVGVYGLGYWWASCEPRVHWPIVAVGLLGKISDIFTISFNNFENRLLILHAKTHGNLSAT